MLSTLHPTKRLLVEATISLFGTLGVDEVTSDMVLEKSKVSKGSLYHHFSDFSELLELSKVYLVSEYVNSTITMMELLLKSCNSRQDLVTNLRGLTRRTQNEASERTRYIRIRSLAVAVHSPRLRLILASEQERLTNSFADLFREAQERGWGSKKVDPRAMGIFVQAYTIGRVLDEFAPTHMDEEKWFHIVDLVIEKVFLGVESA